MAEISTELREGTLGLLKSQPDNFRWTIGNTIFGRDELVKEVEAGSEIGNTVVSLSKGFLMDPDSNKLPNALGKRYVCLVCETTVLATKKGGGRITCCDQIMVIQEPKPLPSSD